MNADLLLFEQMNTNILLLEFPVIRKLFFAFIPYFSITSRFF